MSPILRVLERCLCVTYEYHNSCTLDLLLLKEYQVKESCTKFLHFPSIYPHNPMPLWISRQGEILVLTGHIFMVYNSHENSLRHPKVMNLEHCLGATINVESLVSANASDKEEMETLK